MEVTFEEALAIENQHQPNKRKGTKIVSMDEYILVPHRFMMLDLSDKEILAFSLVHGICSNCESHEFTASNNYVATRLNCSISYANTLMNNLMKKGFMKKISTDNKYGTCTYILPDNLNQVIIDHGSLPE